MHYYTWKKLRIRLNLFRINLFRITVYFFLNDTCIGIIKSSRVGKFFPKSKFPDKSCAVLTRFDYTCIVIIKMAHYSPQYSLRKYRGFPRNPKYPTVSTWKMLDRKKKEIIRLSLVFLEPIGITNTRT